MLSTKTKRYTYFIGIDVSRNELDFAVRRDTEFLFHKEIQNDPDEIVLLLVELKKLPRFTFAKAVFCMEHTGLYCNFLIRTLQRYKANVVQESAMHIRSSLGMLRGKYDKIDAIRITEYAYKNRECLKLLAIKRKAVVALAQLATVRHRLVSLNKALNTPLKEQVAFETKGVSLIAKNLCHNSVAGLKQDIEKIDLLIAESIKSDERLNRLHKIITSIPCVGTVTAVEIITTTNEFINIRTAKKFACYAGVAPFKSESGNQIKKAKVSHFANKRMKALIHICAIGSLINNKELKVYYDRKVKEEGKNKMLVINAIRFKIISRIFTCVIQDRLYEKEYKTQPVE